MQSVFEEEWPAPGVLPSIWLLLLRGRQPLPSKVEARDDVVIWRDFGNEHRPESDYSGFGPFTFDRAAYEHALQGLPKLA